MAAYDLNQIVVFINVVEQKGVRAAADKLGIAQSSVSRAMAALEARLGARLFERSTRAFRITEEGLRYYERCRFAVDSILQADELLRSRGKELAGTLRISAPAVIGKYLLSDAVGAFLSLHPKARVHVDLTDRIVDLVAEGVDLAVRLGPAPEHSLLVTRLLAQPAAGLYASANYLREQGVPRTPADLRGHRTLMLGAPDMLPQWRLRRGSEETVQQLAPCLHTNDIPTLLNATLRGCGICLAPHFVCQQEQLPETLLQVLPEWEHEAVDVRALYPSRHSVTPLLRAFIDLLADLASKTLNVLPLHGSEGLGPAGSASAVRL
jgi:DNA-binding transcriptional LysR family regulator